MLLLNVTQSTISHQIRHLEDLWGLELFARGALKISTLESFALTWLVPRSSDFNTSHPEIVVWISTKDDLVDFAVDGVDMEVRFGRGVYPGLHNSLFVPDFPLDGPRFPNTNMALPAAIAGQGGVLVRGELAANPRSAVQSP